MPGLNKISLQTVRGSIDDGGVVAKKQSTERRNQGEQHNVGIDA
jgi:hypothetical protein